MGFTGNGSGGAANTGEPDISKEILTSVQIMQIFHAKPFCM
jgi:hypothetical protein